MLRPASLLLTAALALPGQGRAATYDPDLTWRTITTAHFHVHFHQGEEKLADDFSTTVEQVYATMTEELQWQPRARTHVVLIDMTDAANGFASSVPYNAITIFVTGPTESSTLGLYEDWLTAIQTHELTHTLHIDTNHGVARAARLVIGRISSTNRLSPAWMVEGLATFQETRHTNGGRGRTPLVDMILRTAALEDDIPGLGRMDGFQADMPAGQIRYLFGRDLMQFVADQQGEDVWTRWTHNYGASVPYILPGKPILGRSLRHLYRDWTRDLQARARATADRALADGPATVGRVISHETGTCTAPTYSPDGERLIWSCLDMRLGSQIWTSGPDGDDAEVLIRDRGANSFTWRSDSKAFVYAGSHVVNRFNTWSDIYLYDLDKDKVTALTQGARARDPDFSPDGSRLLVVTNKTQDNQLELLTVDRQQRALTQNTDHTQLSTPRFSPDGGAVALSVWKDGRRDLWLYTPDGVPVRRLTADGAIERDPRWSADGRWLFFASDRSGVPNVYAIDTTSERLWQVTNVVTGAVAPSPHPDGTRLAWQEYHAKGWRIVVGALDPATWIDRGQLPLVPGRSATFSSLRQTAPEPVATAWRGEPVDRRARPGVPVDPLAMDLPGMRTLPPAARLPDLRQDAGGIDSFDQANVEDAFGAEADYPFRIKPRRYTPLGTLLPRYWVPFVQNSPFAPRKPFDFIPIGLVVSASTGSVDPVRHYAWSASGSYRTDANFLSGGASFTVNRWIPIYNLSVSRTASTPSPLVLESPTEVDDEGNPLLVAGDRYWEKRHTLAASVNYPYTFKTTVFARYALTFRDALDPIPDDALRDYIPLRGALGTVQGGWRYAWSQPTRYAISVEDGRIFSLVGGLIAPWLGAFSKDDAGTRRGLTAVQLTTELRQYTVMPWARNHVVAVRAGAGVTWGSDRFLGLYQLGGSFGDSAYYVTPDSSLMLRGYGIGADVGDLYWLGSAEYRLPLHRFDRGLSTYPVFVRALSAAAFIDAGNAFTDPQGANDIVDGTLVGVGAELRLSAALWYGVGTSIRLGFATGLTGPGFRLIDDQGRFDARVLYARVGGTF